MCDCRRRWNSSLLLCDKKQHPHLLCVLTNITLGSPTHPYDRLGEKQRHSGALCSTTEVAERMGRGYIQKNIYISIYLPISIYKEFSFDLGSGNDLGSGGLVASVGLKFDWLAGWLTDIPLAWALLHLSQRIKKSMKMSCDCRHAK